jgi:hypothetical protein
MHAQPTPTVVPARGTGSGRSLRPWEVHTLLSQLLSLRDVLADVTDRLSTVEVPVDEHTDPHLLLALADVLTVSVPRRGRCRGTTLPLRQLRLAQGWTQTGLISRICAVGRRAGITMPEPGSLKTMVSRWENGAPVGPTYAGILRQVFNLSSTATAELAVAA